MSGQWEVVGKSKQKQSGQPKKLTKGEKKKFVENAPKVEDILPLAQVKTLYTALDNNKENRKPQGKENNAKESEPKKTQKKQPEKKKEVKEKPQTPKSLEMAVKMIDVKDLISELSIGKVRFQEAPLVWLKGLAEYLNLKLDHSSPLTVHKSEYPLSVLSGEIKEVLKQALKDAGETPVQHFYHICLSSMANDMSRGMPVYGYKVMLQLMAFQNPSITVANIPKVSSLLNSYQNRQQIGLAILGAVGQGGVKDIQVGVKAWLEVMVPLIELRNYTSFIVGYLKDIMSNSMENKQVTQEQFFALLDIIHSNNLPNNMKQELLAISPLLRIRTLKTESEKRLRNFFDPLLQRLNPSASKVLREELLTSLVTCLNLDQHCYSIWRQLYTKHLPQSAILLEHIDSQWTKMKEKVAVKMMRETVSTFHVTNEELKKGKHKDEQLLMSCQHSCEELLKKMTVSRSFPWKLGSFFLLLAIAGLLCFDIQKHGSFHSSGTGHFLDDIGALEYAEHAWARTKFYSNKSYRWAEKNVPSYYKVMEDYVKPYVELTTDLCLVLGHQMHHMYINIHGYVEEKTPLVIDWVNHYAPGLLEKIKQQSIVIWEIVKENGLLLWQYFLHYSYLALEWIKTNIFVGSLSPENLQKYSKEALNTTQVYVSWTYDWVCQKVQTLSKIE